MAVARALMGNYLNHSRFGQRFKYVLDEAMLVISIVSKSGHLKKMRHSYFSRLSPAASSFLEALALRQELIDNLLR